MFRTERVTSVTSGSQSRAMMRESKFTAGSYERTSTGSSDVSSDLSVRIWGMAANGQTFSQHIRARNISISGALFSGLEMN